MNESEARASRAGGRNCRKRVVIRRERDRIIQLIETAAVDASTASASPALSIAIDQLREARDKSRENGDELIKILKGLRHE
ncbi:hypothetical protein ACRQD2_08755 [Actinotignum sp. GS-2025e]|uniref:hypothetical protein n=1 Tax=Actinotignum TaxID=1653174 RepID=UPI0025511C66|nr:hypothetical protein [Actinotignum timonense]MDK8283144.1 hypothetical protein [Actinotignum timonense]